MLLAAAGRRIDSCPIEGFSISKLSQVLSQHQLIDPELEKPVVMLALGYRSQREVPAKTRRQLDEIVRLAIMPHLLFQVLLNQRRADLCQPVPLA